MFLNAYNYESQDGKYVGYNIDELARKIYSENGIDGFEFNHGLGHGIGVSVHEYPPNLSKNEMAKIEIKDNMCFTIEPGLYNFPLCLFDRKYWYCYKNSISDYKIRYLRSHASHSSSSHSSHGSHSNHNSHSSGSHSSGGSSHSSGSNTTATVKLPKMQTPQSTPSMQ